MMNTTSNDDMNELDRATAARLARLRTMPLDTSRLERAVRDQIPVPAAQSRKRSYRIGWLRPLHAVAASVTLLAILAAAVLSTSGGPVLASPARMAEFHQKLLTGEIPVMQVDSIEAANRALAAESPRSPEIPGVPQGEHDASPPEAHVMACCLKRMDSKQVACVLLRHAGVPVTMMVADSRDVKPAASPTVVRGGATYHVQSSGALNMVMAEREGRWVCLIGELPGESLMDLAASLKF